MKILDVIFGYKHTYGNVCVKNSLSVGEASFGLYIFMCGESKNK